ncbi:MAG: GNAT family N-acetyltransferase [Firmicutes bacterium]|nr:GNAT family N-acetyltransferase [Bacillota bacterium]
MERDIAALYLLLKDEEVNVFLPWFPVKSIRETEDFYERRFSPKKEENQYYCAVCLKENDEPVGYVKAETDESHDFGYALRKEFWHKGLATEASRALAEKLKTDGVPYLTATHDRNNPRSGGVMRQIGMKYLYSYEENWQPKNIPVIFRLYLMNLDGNEDRTYDQYRNRYKNHVIEAGL